VRWWQLVLGGALLIWVLGTAYHQARRRGRKIGLALVFLWAAVVCFASASLLPRPPVTFLWSQGLIVASIVLLALAMAVVLWKGFRR
jgi:peptidoglycan/LPS O-acetylase OafA/YrhL